MAAADDDEPKRRGGPFSAIRAKILKMEEIGGIALSRHFIYLKGAKDKNEKWFILILF